MARRATSRKNLFGFFEKKTSTTYRSGGVTKRELEQQAFKAGQRSGDTGLFKEWARSKKLAEKWGGALRDFEGAYREGVERGEVIHEKKEAKREAVREKREEKKEQKLELAKVVSEVTDALIAQGMKKGQAQQLARTKYAKGDSFSDLWHKVLAKAPKDNPAASERALKAAGRENFFGFGSHPDSKVSQRERFKRIAEDTIRREHVVFEPFRGSGRLVGESFIATDDTRVVRAAEPTSVNRLFVLLHEIGHHHYRHPDQSGNESNYDEARDERQASEFALSIMKRNGIETGKIEKEERERIADLYNKANIEKTRGVLKKHGTKTASGNPERFRLNPARKNPLNSAEKMFTEMTGLPPTEVLEFKETEHFHKYTSVIGKLVCLDILTVDGKEIPLIAPGFSFSPKRFLRRDIRHSSEAEAANASWILSPNTSEDKLVYVTFTEDGKQIIFRGGDQRIPFKDLGLNGRDERDDMFIGTIVQITYRGKKSFEQDGKEEVDFHHTFGEQGSGGIMPVLGYLLRTQRMVTLGGRYRIAPVRSDIQASPGIVG